MKPVKTNADASTNCSYTEQLIPMPGWVVIKVLDKEEIKMGQDHKIIVPKTIRDNEGSIRAEVIAYGGPKAKGCPDGGTVFEQDDLRDYGIIPGSIIAVNRMHGLFVEANAEDHKLVKQEDIACIIS